MPSLLSVHEALLQNSTAEGKTAFADPVKLEHVMHGVHEFRELARMQMLCSQQGLLAAGLNQCTNIILM